MHNFAYLQRLAAMHQRYVVAKFERGEGQDPSWWQYQDLYRTLATCANM